MAKYYLKFEMIVAFEEGKQISPKRQHQFNCITFDKKDKTRFEQILRKLVPNAKFIAMKLIDINMTNSTGTMMMVYEIFENMRVDETGISKALNGGYGMVLDGSKRVDEILESAMLFDVMGGVSRRAWARNKNAVSTSKEYNKQDNNSSITIPYLTDEEYIKELVNDKYDKGGQKNE